MASPHHTSSRGSSLTPQHRLSTGSLGSPRQKISRGSNARQVLRLPSVQNSGGASPMGSLSLGGASPRVFQVSTPRRAPSTPTMQRIMSGAMTSAVSESDGLMTKSFTSLALVPVEQHELHKACRICMLSGENPELGELFLPCRCTGMVHRRCLDTWRCTGFNPANLTRCEVCHYRYRFSGDGTGFWVMFFLLRTVLSEVVAFIACATLIGYCIRTSKILDEIDFGKLAHFKPHKKRHWFYLGIMINFFVIGLLATALALGKFFCGGNSVRETSRILLRRSAVQRKEETEWQLRSPWVVKARHRRNRSSDWIDPCVYMCCGSWYAGFLNRRYIPDCYCCCDDICFTIDTLSPMECGRDGDPGENHCSCCCCFPCCKRRSTEDSAPLIERKKTEDAKTDTAGAKDAAQAQQSVDIESAGTASTKTAPLECTPCNCEEYQKFGKCQCDPRHCETAGPLPNGWDVNSFHGEGGLWLLLMLVAVVVIVFALIGVFLSMWVLFFNVIYAFQTHARDLREAAASRYVVLPYDAALDTMPDETVEDCFHTGGGVAALIDDVAELQLVLAKEWAQRQVKAIQAQPGQPNWRQAQRELFEMDNAIDAKLTLLRLGGFQLPEWATRAQEAPTQEEMVIEMSTVARPTSHLML